jgi:nitroreductase
MKTLDAIRTRRSVRDWTDQDVPDELIQKILEAGRWSPSAHNFCLTRYVVIRDPKTIALVSRTAKEAHVKRLSKWSDQDVHKDLKTLPPHLREAENVKQRRYSDFYDHLLKAKVIIAVCAETTCPLEDAERLGYKGGKSPYHLFDAYMATQNILLAMHDVGLGGLVHIRALMHDRAGIARALNLPKDWMLHALIPLGWPNQKPVVEKPPLEKIVYYERYPNQENPYQGK